MTDSISLEEQIKVQRQHMWICLVWVCLLLIAGVIVTVYIHQAGSTPDKYAELIKMGPTMVSAAISAFPGKFCLDCRARLATYRTLQNNIKHLDNKTKKKIIAGVLEAALRGTV